MGRPKVVFGCHINCGNCSWQSGTWFGEGSRRNAWGEYRSHKEKCIGLKRGV